jgi:hypothetical protein
VTTDQPPAPIAVILGHAADLIEQKRYVWFQGGPNLWSALHRVTDDATPAAEHLRRFLGVSHVQFWFGDQAAAVTALRAAAAAVEPAVSGG